MGQPKLTEIEAGLAEWDFLTKLPQSVGSFHLEKGTGIDGQILNIAAYVNEPLHCRLDIIYTAETFDYVTVKTVGMHIFRDERYFARDREKFARMLLQDLERILSDLDRAQPHAMDWEARELGFEAWDYWRQLPKQVGDFELYITPDNPLPYLNGSFIFLDYSDFAHGDQLYLMYNIFRNEIFAEMKKRYFPITTDLFDVVAQVPDERKLKQLSTLLAERLQKTLSDLGKS